MGSNVQSGNSGSSTTNSWLTQGSNKDKLQGWLDNQWGMLDNPNLIPDKDREQLGQWGTDALGQLAGGMNSGALTGIGNINTGLGQMASGMGQAGWGQLQSGLGQMGSLFGEGGALTQQGMLDSMSNFYDSEMVQSQMNQLGKDVGDQLGKAVQGINQGASASGGMGSSRAGVMEGVATGKAADAIASGSASIQNAARENAFAQAMGLGQQQLAGAQAQIQFGQSMMGAANQAANQMGGWYGQMGSMGRQDVLDKLGAAGVLQQEGQANKDQAYMNQLKNSNPGLYNMLMLQQALNPMAGWSQTTTGSSTSNSSGKGLISSWL